MLQNSQTCGVSTARIWQYVWPFYNIMHERVKGNKKRSNSRVHQMFEMRDSKKCLLTKWLKQIIKSEQIPEHLSNEKINWNKANIKQIIG